MTELPQAIARLRALVERDAFAHQEDKVATVIVLDAFKEITEAAREGMEAFRDYDRASDVGGAGFDLSRMSLAAHSVAALLTRYDLLEPKGGP